MYCEKWLFVLQVSDMAETRRRSLRIEDGLWERFCAISGTQNEAFRKLLDGDVEASGLTQKIYERAGRIENMVEELLGLGVSVPTVLSQAQAHVPVSGFVAAEATADLRPRNATCKHCGTMFAGARFATICPGCKSIGHTLTAAECPVCGEGLSI